ncbi:hypothetical protein WN943_014456 [Citrus x changshan-huyou]
MPEPATITATAVGLVAGAFLGVVFQEITVAIKESKSRWSNLPMGLWSSGRVFALRIMSARVRASIKAFMGLIYNPSSIIT